MNLRDQNIASKIKTLILEKDPMAEVLLYGSRARQDNHEHSDWDILILLDRQKVDLDTEKEFRDYLFNLELEIGEPISVFVRSKNDWDTRYSITPFYQNIKKEGMTL